MSRAESPDARAERLTAELRAATADAAGVVRDLERVAKLARAQIDEYLPREVERVLNAYVRQMEEHGLRICTQATTEVNRVAQKATNRASEVIENATTVAVLADAVASKVASLTRYTNGEPEIVYGYGTDADGLRLKD